MKHSPESWREVRLSCPVLFWEQESEQRDVPEASLVAQRVKRLPAIRETRVQALGWEDPLEKEMATHSSTLSWKIPWTEEPGRLQSTGWSPHGVAESDATVWLHCHFLSPIMATGGATEPEQLGFHSAGLGERADRAPWAWAWRSHWLSTTVDYSQLRGTESRGSQSLTENRCYGSWCP